MPPSEPARRVSYTDGDEVDDYIRSRQRRRARLSAAAAGLDVLDVDAEFTWDMPRADGRGRLDHAGGIRGEVLDLPVDDAWRAAAAARHATPRAVDQSLDEWGSRVTDATPAPIAAPASIGAPDSIARPIAERASVLALRDPFAEPPAPARAAGRRTVVITGRGAEGYHARRSHRQALRPHERAGFRPDRVAMWAVLLGLALLLVAATSSHAAVLALHTALHAAH